MRLSENPPVEKPVDELPNGLGHKALVVCDMGDGLPRVILD